MKMKNFCFLFLFSITLSFPMFAQSDDKKIAPTQAEKKSQPKYKRFKTKTMQADNPHELQVILEGRRQFIPSPNDRKPSKHMLDKMQSSHE